MKDQLAGRREEINQGTAYSLMWPDTGDGCPVDMGHVEELRSCRIEITKTHRVKKDRKWWWRAEFARYPKSDQPAYLARRGGLTTDRKQAMAAQDDPEPGTLRAIALDERDQSAAVRHAALGEQPEPEAVPKDEIDTYTGSRVARQRYLLEMAEERVAEQAAPLEERIARLREISGVRHVDITAEMRVIERTIKRAERKVLERAA